MEKKQSKITYRLIRSSRKTLGLEITKNAEILVRAPYRTSQAEIDRFVSSHTEWIRTHMVKIQERKEEREKVPVMTREEVEWLAQQALVDIPARVRKYAPIVGVTYGRITIRNQKTKWGSCSGKGNLNFNCLLMLCPEEVRDYVVVHELCHRLEMNHSDRFWSQVERVLPDYRKGRDYLKNHGGVIMARMFGA